jgi:hypothetical protein
MKNSFLLFISSLLLLLSCGSDPLDVDVSEVEYSLELERFDQEMFAVENASEMTRLNQDLIERGGELYEFYVHEMLHSGSVFDDSIGDYLYYFVSDSTMKMAFQDVDARFGNFESKKEGLTDMFKHLKYHLPTALLPEKVIVYNSAFNYGVISTNNQIGLGLDMYLGQHNQIISQLGFPIYMKEKMMEDYMLVDIAHSWLATNVMVDPGNTFLSKMIYYGKLRYLIDAMLPETPDYLKIRYTEEEYDFSLASEDDIWQFLLDMNWVYSTDMKVGLRFFEEAPTTVGIEGSPGRIGQFMGWRMVQQYMESNSELTVQELLAETTESNFLKTYKPDNE